jgi:hypothetical protein
MWCSAAMGAEGLVELVQAQLEAFQGPFHPHQEQAGGAVLVLVGVQDVGVVPEQEVGDGGDQAFFVRAGDQEYGGVAHGECAPGDAVQKGGNDTVSRLRIGAVTSDLWHPGSDIRLRQATADCGKIKTQIGSL